LKNHFRLLREGYSQFAPCWSDRQTEIDCVAFRANQKRCQCAASSNCSFQKIATGQSELRGNDHGAERSRLRIAPLSFLARGGSVSLSQTLECEMYPYWRSQLCDVVDVAGSNAHPMSNLEARARSAGGIDLASSTYIPLHLPRCQHCE
jgi:hypothetical protein